jgi:DNA polymerase elongation subunit (family B)
VSQEVDEIEQSAYYGGVVQVFNHAIQSDVKYVDVNSLYPAAMTMIKISRVPADPPRPFKYRLGDN